MRGRATSGARTPGCFDARCGTSLHLAVSKTTTANIQELRSKQSTAFAWHRRLKAANTWWSPPSSCRTFWLAVPTQRLRLIDPPRTDILNQLKNKLVPVGVQISCQPTRSPCLKETPQGLRRLQKASYAENSALPRCLTTPPWASAILSPCGLCKILELRESAWGSCFHR